jgi:hypothetical protein
MPGHRSRKCRSPSSSSSSSSDYDKHHKKHKKYCLKIESDSTRSRSRSNDSKTEVESYTNDDKCKKHSKKHSRKHSKKHSHNSDKSDCCNTFNICDIYQFFKNRLLLDENLMVSGSNAYLYATNNELTTILQSCPMQFNNVALNYNIENPVLNAPFYVRESGVYLAFFVCNTDNSAQFTLFINNDPIHNTCVGSNSGAGLVISRHMIELKKDDYLVVRNYESSSGSIRSQLYNGGLLPGNNLTFLLIKIAVLPMDNECYTKEKPKKKMCKLFNKLKYKLLNDNELMVKGFDVSGSFYNNVNQLIPLETDVIFSTQQNVNKLTWNISNPSQVVIQEDGVYKLFFLANTHTPAQLAVCVNGVPVDNTIMGTNKGAGQMTIRCILELKQNDVVSIRNHTTAAPNGGIIDISTNAGGKYITTNCILTIFKIAPLVKPQVKPVDCKLEKHFHCYYDMFKKYLLSKQYLQLEGSNSYGSFSSSSHQALTASQTFYWSNNNLLNNMWHTQGSTEIMIKKSGVYDVFGDVLTDEPMQYTLFVNGTPDLSTVSGRDSGASRCLMRQFVKLDKGDILTVKNYESNNNIINTALNPGGMQVGQNVQFMTLLLRPLCDSHDDSDSETEKCPKPQPVKPVKPLKPNKN